MEITNMQTTAQGKVKAKFSVKTEEGFLIPGFRLVQGHYGFFTAWPNTKSADGVYNPVVVPCEESLKDAVTVMAEEAYRLATKGK